MRIATKYWNLTQRFFAAHGIALYRVVESLGATEGAPAAGTADLIVDITTTGSTLDANHLKVLDDGVILRSEAKLAASLPRRGAVPRAPPPPRWQRVSTPAASPSTCRRRFLQDDAAGQRNLIGLAGAIAVRQAQAAICHVAASL